MSQFEVSLYDEVHLQPYHREIVHADSERDAVLRFGDLDPNGHIVVEGDGWWRLAPLPGSTRLRFARVHPIPGPP
jgi:hypothetical protein